MKETKNKATSRALSAILLILVLLLIINPIACTTKEKPIVLKSTESGKCGDFRWAITSILRTDATGPEDKMIRGKGELLIVGVNIKNELKRKTRLDPSVLTLSDKQGREYTPDKSLTGSYLAMLGAKKYKAIYDTELLPLERAVVFAIFDVKRDTKGLQLKVSGDKVGGQRDLIFKIDL